jgi:cell division topological specificity factor
MSVFGLFKRRGSAPVARERLQLLLSYERAAGSQLDLVTVLREEILNALTKHIRLEPDNVRVKMDRGDTVSTLAVDIEIPNGVNGLLSARL